MHYKYTTTCLLALAVAAGLLLAACDMAGGGFLEEQPKGSLGGDVVANQSGVETLLVGAYSALSATETTAGASAGIAGGDAWMSDPSNWPYGAVASDVAEKGSVPNDQTEVNLIQTNRWDPTNGYFNGVWSNRYEGVARANEVLRTMRQADDISPADTARIAGEARFLRAHFYFDLKKMFSNVPWIDEFTENFNQPNTGPEAEDVWQKIEEDLQFARANLPEVQSSHARANNWAAAAYLAKAHVYQGEWDEAKALFDEVITSGATASGVPYALSEQYSDNFNAATQDDGNPEIIFSVEMTGDDGSGEIANSWTGMKLNYPHGVAPFNCCGFFLASHDLANSFKTDANGLPQIDSYDDPNDVLKNDQGVLEDEQYTPPQVNLDPRIDWTMGRRGIPYHDHGPHPGARYIRGNANYAGPYSPKKHVWRNANQSIAYNPNSWAPGTGVDYPVIRFSDVLLMAAEAEVQSGSGTMEQARQYVNRVRQRAANPNGFVDNSMNEAFALAVVDNEADMLSSNPNPFDWVVRTDRNATFMYLGSGPATDASNWNEYPNPADTYNIDTYSQAEFANNPLEKIHFERKLELAMEGHRFFDLVRWERAEERMNDYYNYQGALTSDVRGASFQNSVFPIPQTQIDLSVQDGEPLLQQNSGY